MNLIPLNFITRLFGKNVYNYNPSLFNQSKVLTGSPEWLNPDNWDAYNIFLTTPQLYSVIKLKGSLHASGVWRHIKVDKDGKEIGDVPNSEVLRVLNNPNPLLSGVDYIKQWNENLNIYGNNYEKLVRPASMYTPEVMYNLPPGQIEIKLTGKMYGASKIDEIIEFYKLVQLGGVTEEFKTRDINHTRIVSGNNPVKGDSPLIPLYMPISNLRAAYGFRNVIITKKGALGILSNHSKDNNGAIPLGNEERKRLETEYHKMYGISDEQMQVIMTNASLTWQPMTFPTKDLMLFEEVDDDFLTIIDHYGLNINLFSRKIGSTYENLSAGLKQAYQVTIIPEAAELALNRAKMFELPSDERLIRCFKHIPVLQENEKEKSEVQRNKADAIQKLIASGYTKEQAQSVIVF